VRISPFKLAIEFESETNQDSTASVRTQKRYFKKKKQEEELRNTNADGAMVETCRLR